MVLPTRGQADWDDELNNEIQRLDGDVQTAKSDASSARSTAISAAQSADAAAASAAQAATSAQTAANAASAPADEAVNNVLSNPASQASATLAATIDQAVVAYTAPVLLLDPGASVPAETPIGALVFRKVVIPYSDVVLADLPVGYWRLDETAAGPTIDSSGSGLNGTGPVGGYTLGVAPLATAAGGTAVSFNGIDGRIPLPTSTAFEATDAGGFTFEAWVKLTNPNADALQLIATKTDISTNTHKQWYVAYDNRVSQGSPQRLRFIVGQSSVILDWSAAGTAVGNGGHLVCRKDGNTLSMWWNGAQVASTTAATFGLVTNTKGLNLAGYSGGTSWLGGTLDEVAIYQAALSDARIMDHYRAGS